MKRGAPAEPKRQSRSNRTIVRTNSLIIGTSPMRHLGQLVPLYRKGQCLMFGVSPGAAARISSLAMCFDSVSATNSTS